MENIKKDCPIKNKKLFLILAISIAILIVCIDLIMYYTSLKETGVGCGFSRFWGKDQQTTQDDNDLVIKKDSITKEGFTLNTTYTGNNLWEFTITGELPNPCYTTDIQSLVAESYPEQVSIVIDVIEPPEGVMCAQVIQNLEYEATFSASEQASVSLEVR